MQLTREELAGMIDHTLLKPEATRDMLDRLTAEAKEHAFASVCVNPYWVTHASDHLRGSGVLVCAVVGFPLGSDVPGVKASEAASVVRLGAGEVDMVMNVGAFLSGDRGGVRDDIAGVVDAAGGKPVKVILETGFLSDSQVEEACVLSVEAGAAFVKTSTGFGPPCTPSHVALMKKAVAGRALVKAAGGIRTFEDALTMIRAGADRLGASAGVAILGGWKPVEV